MNWHYVEEGQQVGPVSDDRLLELERSGKINADSLVWREGLTDWKPFSQIKSELKPSVPAAVSSEPVGSGAGVPPVSALGKGPEAVCGECGKIFPIDEMIRHGGTRICSACKPVFMQKLSEGARINTGGMRYAGFGVRFGAKFLDGLIIGVPLMVAYMAVLIPMIGSRPPGQVPRGMETAPFLMQIGMFLAQMAYQIFFLGKYGATPGKMICKLKVVTAEGGPIGYGRAAGRFFAEMLSMITCYIGYFLVLFDDQKRALHDRICKTRVIYK